MRKVALFILQDKNEVHRPDLIFSRSKALREQRQIAFFNLQEVYENKNKYMERDFKIENEIQAEDNIIIIVLIICGYVN